MPRMTGSRLFAEMLQGYGVTHVFFVPTILLESLAEMDGLGIRKILTHSEKSAAYMADGYARAAGRPGVCLAQQIGASNLASGLRDAFMACTPMIAISGGPATPGRYRRAYQEVEDITQFDAVTKLNMTLDDLSRFPDLVRQAFRVATTGTPGPVHLRLRGSHGQGVEGEAELQPLVEPQFSRVPAFRPGPDSERVREAVALLSRAQKPIIVAGGGVVTSQAQAELVELADKLQIPVATSLTAKGAHPGQPPAVGRRGRHVFARVRQPRGIRSRSRVLRRLRRRRAGNGELEDTRRRHAGNPVGYRSRRPRQELSQHCFAAGRRQGDAAPDVRRRAAQDARQREGVDRRRRRSTSRSGARGRSRCWRRMPRPCGRSASAARSCRRCLPMAWWFPTPGTPACGPGR